MDNIWVIFIVIMVISGLVSLSAWLGIKVDNLKYQNRYLSQKVESLTEHLETYRKILSPGERRGEG